MTVPPRWVVCGLNECRLVFRAYWLFLSLTYRAPSMSGPWDSQGLGRWFWDLPLGLVWSLEPTEVSEVIDISPSNLDSSLCFFQPSISHDVLCI